MKSWIEQLRRADHPSNPPSAKTIQSGKRDCQVAKISCSLLNEWRRKEIHKNDKMWRCFFYFLYLCRHCWWLLCGQRVPAWVTCLTSPPLIEWRVAFEGRGTNEPQLRLDFDCLTFSNLQLSSSPLTAVIEWGRGANQQDGELWMATDCSGRGQKGRRSTNSFDLG